MRFFVAHVQSMRKEEYYGKKCNIEISNRERCDFLEVNSKDYGLKVMEKLVQDYDTEKVKQVAGYAHMYVFYYQYRILSQIWI